MYLNGMISTLFQSLTIGSNKYVLASVPFFLQVLPFSPQLLIGPSHMR